MLDMSLSKNQTAPACYWNNVFNFCTNIMRYVATDEGICYQFNGLNAEDIYRDARSVAGFCSFHIELKSLIYLQIHQLQ